ncbi:MAG TPA: hypothetical protein VJR89_35205 [Polyangiales bacterium]|nr:hypothetical protein [Polyangiales bacterium]
MGGWLHHLSQVWILFGLLAAMFAAEALGRREGHKHREYGGPDARSQVGALEGAALGLLALLLGFTFSMAALRFDARRELTQKEANAIGTALLRTELVAEPEQSALKQLLVRYVDARIEFYDAGFEGAKFAAVTAKAERMHAEIWRHAVAAARRDPGPTTALLVSALNDMIDLHGARVAALYNNVPDAVIWFLLVLSVLAVGIAGYASGVSNARYWPATFIVILLVASVVMVIIDLDRPRRGLIRAGQPAMLELQRSLKPTAH